MKKNEPNFGKVTEEEFEEFRQFRAGLGAVDEMLEVLVDKKTKLMLRRDDFWNEVYGKYSLERNENHYLDGDGYIRHVK